MKFRTIFAPGVALVCCLAVVACSGASGSAKAEIPDSPDGTIKVVASELANHRPQILWEALPASYQQDISQITHDFAAKMDPELYNQLVAFAQKAVTVLLDKKELILGSSMVQLKEEDLADIEQGWNTSLVALDTLLHSEISNIESLKTIDLNAFLAGTGSALMDQAAAASKETPEDPFENEVMARLHALQVELLESDADTAKVKVSVPDEDSEELRMVRVEGRWIPAEMAETWDKDVAEAKIKVAELSEEEMAQAKMQGMLFLAMADSFLDQLAAVQSSEEFDALAQGLLGGFMGGGTPPPPPQEITGG